MKAIDNGPQRQTSCKRCGTCCINGGPALHEADLPLIESGAIPRDGLVTIRQGEPVYSPLINGMEPSRSELIKIAGHGGSWACRYYQAQPGCGIYADRPIECRLLQCWDTAALTAIVYRQCLSRGEILAAGKSLWELVRVQEEHCAFGDLAQLNERFTEATSPEVLDEISRMLTLDLRIRQRAVQVLGMSLAEELLAFGRPMFKSLPFYNLNFQETVNGLRVMPATT